VTMTKRELVIQVANKLGMTQSDVARIVEGAFDAISKSLAEGQRWELRDFGVFEVKVRASRIGRNPRTGEQVPVPERRVVTFRPGKQMKELVAKQAAADASARAAALAAGNPAPASPASIPSTPESSGD
jgi:integration host factor subunit beta